MAHLRHEWNPGTAVLASASVAAAGIISTTNNVVAACKTTPQPGSVCGCKTATLDYCP